MKFFQKRWVALILCAVMIAVSFGIAGQKHDADIFDPDDIDSAEDWGEQNYASYERYVSDGANLFSNGTEKELAEFNASFDYSYGSICGIATVSGLDGQAIDDAAYEVAEELGLGSRDYLLLLDKNASDWYFVYGEEASHYIDHELEILVTGAMDTIYRDSDDSILEMFDELEDWYEDSMPSASSDYGRTDGDTSEDDGGIIGFLIVLILIVAIFSPATPIRRRRVGGWWPVFVGRRGPHIHVHHTPPPVHHFGPKPGAHHKSGPKRNTSSRPGGAGGFGGGNRGGFGKGGGFGGKR